MKVYLVQHGESKIEDPDRPLIEKGKETVLTTRPVASSNENWFSGKAVRKSFRTLATESSGNISTSSCHANSGSLPYPIESAINHRAKAVKAV
ncbi:hypothetical protein M1O16_00650 [Dehalococcoidia bacterium]|nr:hypothetical protein [Dehalococcoidia bacterium]